MCHIGASSRSPAAAHAARESPRALWLRRLPHDSGVREASATVGPPLADWGERAYVAGRLANTPKNLARWIAGPQSIEPGTAMPDLGVPPSTAREIADQLFTLR